MRDLRKVYMMAIEMYRMKDELGSPAIERHTLCQQTDYRDGRCLLETTELFKRQLAECAGADRFIGRSAAFGD